MTILAYTFPCAWTPWALTLHSPIPLVLLGHFLPKSFPNPFGSWYLFLPNTSFLSTLPLTLSPGTCRSLLCRSVSGHVFSLPLDYVRLMTGSGCESPSLLPDSLSFDIHLAVVYGVSLLCLVYSREQDRRFHSAEVHMLVVLNSYLPQFIRRQSLIGCLLSANLCAKC